MSRLKVVGLVVGLALMALLWSSRGLGEKDDKIGDKGASKRLLYVVRHGSAKELAKALGQFFKKDAEFEAVADGASNALLINVAPGAFDEVVKALEQLDRSPRLIAVEVLLAEALVDPKKKDDKEIDEKELTGPAEEVGKKIEALTKAGRLGTLKRLEVVALENRSVSAQAMENKPMIVGSTVTGTGIVSNRITYREVGTQLKVTARAVDDKGIALELTVLDARMHTPEDGIALGGDKDKPVRAAEMANSTVETKLTLKPGHSVVVSGVKTTSKSGQAQTVMIVTARLLDTGK
jgi:type II secretory pathway component GspD/PulD (secretin)